MVHSSAAWPNALVGQNGGQIKTSAQFLSTRRPERLSMNSKRMSTAAPYPGSARSFRVTSVDPNALGGVAIRKQITIVLKSGSWSATCTSCFICPPLQPSCPRLRRPQFRRQPGRKRRPGIDPSNLWLRDPALDGVPWQRSFPGISSASHPRARAQEASLWQIEAIVGAGLAWPPSMRETSSPTSPLASATASAAVLSRWKSAARCRRMGRNRCMGLGHEPHRRLPQNRLSGRRSRHHRLRHSRFGKTALWAAAQDKRFAMSSPTSPARAEHPFAPSGRRDHRPRNIAFPYWFCPTIPFHRPG